MIDYIPPNSTVDRVFNIQVSDFTPVAIAFNLKFKDVIADDPNMYFVPSSSAISSSDYSAAFTRKRVDTIESKHSEEDASDGAASTDKKEKRTSSSSSSSNSSSNKKANNSSRGNGMVSESFTLGQPNPESVVRLSDISIPIFTWLLPYGQQHQHQHQHQHQQHQHQHQQIYLVHPRVTRKVFIEIERIIHAYYRFQHLLQQLYHLLQPYQQLHQKVALLYVI